VTGRHDPYAAFRVEDYRRYLGGWIVALLTYRIQGVAIGWEMYERTGRPLALGLVGLVQALPLIALALPAGYLADRFDRRRVLVVSLAGMTAASLGLAAVSHFDGPIPLMYALLFLDAAALSLGRPARMSLLPQLVPRGIFPNAVTWNTSMWQVASVVGPAIGGFIIGFTPAIAYVLAALGSVFYASLLSRITIRKDVAAPERISRESALAGLRFVRRSRGLLAAITLDMFAVLLGGATFLLPIYATDILRVGAHGFGALNAAPAAGALFTALVLAFRPPLRHAGRDLLLAVTGFGVATIVFGFSRSYPLSLAMLFLTGAFDNVSVVIRHTLIQLMTPDQMRGRVSAVNGIFISVSNELGGFESGVVADAFGPVASAVSGGVGTIAVVATVAAFSPELRAVGALHATKVADAEEERPQPVSRPRPPRRRARVRLP
jgi:MFS family permease